MSTRTRHLVLVIGPLAALVLSAATSGIHGDVASAAVGIGLALLVTSAALVGRGPALATALTASLSYNFFHTEPVHTFRVQEPGDLMIVVLLAVLGVIVGDVMTWRERRLTTAAAHQRSSDAVAGMSDVADHFVPVHEAWSTTVEALLDEMRLVECRFVRDDPAGMPHIARRAHRTDADEDEFVLPQTGAVVRLQQGDEVLGALVLLPRSGQGAVRLRRSSVVALADDFALAAARSGD